MLPILTFVIFILCVPIFGLLSFVLLCVYTLHRPENFVTHTFPQFVRHHPSFTRPCAFNFVATSSRSLIIADHRSFPRMATTLSWAERHPGSILPKTVRPFSVI